MMAMIGRNIAKINVHACAAPALRWIAEGLVAISVSFIWIVDSDIKILRYWDIVILYLVIAASISYCLNIAFFAFNIMVSQYSNIVFIVFNVLISQYLIIILTPSTILIMGYCDIRVL